MKHERIAGEGEVHVAPYTGAWIETMEPEITNGDIVVAPYTGAWIETPHRWRMFIGTPGRTLHGCVD